MPTKCHGYNGHFAYILGVALILHKNEEQDEYHKPSSSWINKFHINKMDIAITEYKKE